MSIDIGIGTLSRGSAMKLSPINSGTAPLSSDSLNVAHVLDSTSGRWRKFECIDWAFPPWSCSRKTLASPSCPTLSIRFFGHTLQLWFRLSQGLLLCLPHRFRVR
jgi:hypothetical protein